MDALLRIPVLVWGEVIMACKSFTFGRVCRYMRQLQIIENSLITNKFLLIDFPSASQCISYWPASLHCGRSLRATQWRRLHGKIISGRALWWSMRGARLARPEVIMAAGPAGNLLCSLRLRPPALGTQIPLIKVTPAPVWQTLPDMTCIAAPNSVLLFLLLLALLSLLLLLLLLPLIAACQPSVICATLPSAASPSSMHLAYSPTSIVSAVLPTFALLFDLLLFVNCFPTHSFLYCYIFQLYSYIYLFHGESLTTNLSYV